MELNKTILVTGASGYIGGHLIPTLLERGYRVRVLVRSPETIKNKRWINQVEVVPGDLLEAVTLKPALESVNTAFYLVHNMASGRHYEKREIASATNFAVAAEDAGLSRTIYLGGLAHPGETMGNHMLSRLKTGEALRSRGGCVTEFRASLVIGSGSTSFEMIRHLTEILPMLVGPRMMRSLCQPIALQDVLAYLLAGLESERCWGGTYEIGGRDVLTYVDTMTIFARLRGLKRNVLLLPWVPLQLMAFMVGRLTPIPASIARPLIGGMKGSSDVRGNAAAEAFPQVKPVGYAEAVKRALGALTPDSFELVVDRSKAVAREFREGFFIEKRIRLIHAPVEKVFGILSRMGGGNGWLTMDLLWKARGWLDALLGGPGLRGRKTPDALAEGDYVDYYQVEKLIPSRLLRLRAELKAPGQGWMEWRVEPQGGDAILSQVAYFAPHGFWGYGYWMALLPVHTMVFARLMRAISIRAGEPGR